MRLKSNTPNKPLQLAKILLCISVLLFTACTKDEEAPATIDGDDSISFRFTIDSPTETAIRAIQSADALSFDESLDEVSPRVVSTVDWKTQWEDGDEIGIFGTPNPAGNTFSNAKLTYNKATGEWKGDVRWPSNTVKYNFCAYYPYSDNGGNPAAINPQSVLFQIKTDQRAAADFGKSHFLTGSCTSVGKGEPVNINFSHTMMMIQVTLANTSTVDPTNPPTVKLLQVNTNVSVNILSGNYSNVNTPADITMYRMENPGDANYGTSYTYRALLPVQAMQMNRNYFRIHNGSITLEGGKLASAQATGPGKAFCFIQSLP